MSQMSAGCLCHLSTTHNGRFTDHLFWKVLCSFFEHSSPSTLFSMRRRFRFLFSRTRGLGLFSQKHLRCLGSSLVDRGGQSETRQAFWWTEAGCGWGCEWKMEGRDTGGWTAWTGLWMENGGALLKARQFSYWPVSRCARRNVES